MWIPSRGTTEKEKKKDARSFDKGNVGNASAGDVVSPPPFCLLFPHEEEQRGASDRSGAAGEMGSIS